MKQILFLVMFFCLAGFAWGWVDETADYRKQFSNADRLEKTKKYQEAEDIFVDLARSDWCLADLAAARARGLAAKQNKPQDELYWNHFLIDHFPHSPLRPEAILDLARAFLDSEDYEKAEEILTRLLKDCPQNLVPQAGFLLGTSLEKRGLAQRAADAYGKAAFWYVGKYAFRAEKALKKLKIEGVQIQYPPPAQMWEKIRENFRRRWYQTAGALADRFTAYYPDNENVFRARILAVDALLARRKKTEAKKRLEVLRKIARKQEEKLAVNIRQVKLNRNATSAQKKKLYLAAAEPPVGSATRLDGQLALAYFYWDERQYDQFANWAKKIIDEKNRHLFLPEQIRWRAGFADFLQGRFQEAARHFQYFLDKYPDHSDADAAHYWLARSLQELKKNESAKQVYRACHDRWIGSYYGLLSEARLVELGVPRSRFVVYPAETQSEEMLGEMLALPTIRPEWAQQGGGGTTLDDGARRAIEAYAADAPDDLKPIYNAVRDLLAMNMNEQALAWLDFIRDRVYQTAEGAYFHSVAYGLVGDNHRSILAANEALGQIRQGKLQDPHQLVRRRCYPVFLEDLVFPHAKKYDLDPYFVMAVIKQESAFQVHARSWVGAAGLMQVMPSTGRYIARRRKISGFRTSSLYKPEVSLDFGCWLMADLKRKSGHDMAAMLAGYNAGYGRPLRWWPQHAERTYEELIELIPFNETKGYVKHIFRNFEMYQRLYRDTPGVVPDRVNELAKLTDRVKQLPE